LIAIPDTTMRRLAAGVAIGTAMWLLATAIGRTNFLKTIELKTYDLRLRATAQPGTARKDIVLVEIGESSIRRMADKKLAGRWPWPRAVHAGVIDFIARGGARAIAVDVLFLELDTREGFMNGQDRWSGGQSDTELVRAVRGA
jgi:adenylate cyclase